MHSATVQTLAPVQTETEAVYTGVLVRNAEARSTVAEGGYVLPVLCLEVELENGLRTRMRVEQPFKQGHHTQCEAAAHRLKSGMRVTVHAPILKLRLVAANTTHIHTHPKDPS